jgi:biopolymer transport protein ExbD
MAFKPQSEDEGAMSEINVTPLLTQSVHVTLPKTAETTADVKEQPLQLGIDAQGTITLNFQGTLKSACIYTPIKTSFIQKSPKSWRPCNMPGLPK